MSSKTGFIGAGAVDVAIKNKNTGVWGGWTPISNCPKFEYTGKSKTETIQSFGELTFGQAFDSEEIPEPGELNFTVSEVDKHIIAMTLAASMSETAVTAGTVTAETHTISSGESVLLDKNYVSDLVVKQTGVTCAFADSGDLVTANAHGLRNGQKVIFTDVTTTTGITENTDYYVVNAAANTFQVAATVGGAALTLTTDGTGVFDGVLVSGTDYSMISNNHFEVLKTGLSAKVLSAAYSYAAADYIDMNIGAENHTIRVRFNGVNRRSNKRMYMLLPDITVSSGVALALVSDKFQAFDIKGVVNIDKDTASATYGKPGIFRMEL
jgi:hypothetical protein